MTAGNYSDPDTDRYEPDDGTDWDTRAEMEAEARRDYFFPVAADFTDTGEEPY